MRKIDGATVLIVGLGDLGRRIATLLAGNAGIERLVLAGRRQEQGEEEAGGVSLLATLLNGPRVVSFELIDIDQREQTVQSLAALQPDVVVLAASSITWWRSPAGDDAVRAAQLARLPYGAWLPVQVSLVRSFMEAWRESGCDGTVVSLPLPDCVGPVLLPLGLAPHLGAGNVTEDAAKLQLLAAREAGVSREAVDVRLVLHHAAERISFPLFAQLAGEADLSGEPPWYAEVQVRGIALPATEVDRLFRAAYPRPAGVTTHAVTAAAAVHLVTALLSDTPVATHAPSPGGLPGGYPIVLSRHELDLRLPDSLSATDAISINQEAARWDGLRRVEADGTIVFTDAIADATETILGLRLHRVPPNDLDQVAGEMLHRARHNFDRCSPAASSFDD